MRSPGLPVAADAAGYRGDVSARSFNMADATFGVELVTCLLLADLTGYHSSIQF
jgi:hypothetical protein